eukprot:g2667.t1
MPRSHDSAWPAWWADTKHFLVPGLTLAALCFFFEQPLIGSVLVTAVVGFLSWVLYHRCGLLASITPKRGVTYALRHLRDNLHNRLYQARCLETLSALIAMRASKGPRIVERGGVALVVRSLLLYGDGDEDGGDSEITMSAMNVLLGLLRTSPESAAPKLLESWPIKDVATRLVEVSGDLDRSEEERDEHSLTMLKLISQICEAVNADVRGGALAWRNELVDAVITTMQRTVRSEKSESMQQWACCVLYNLQHQSLALKERIAKAGGMARVLDAVRIHRDSVKVNKMAAVLLCEILFEPIPDVQSSEKVAENKTELRFLPEVLAEAIDLGVMQALYEMQKHHTDCVEIFNCNRLIKHELGKERKVSVAEDAATFTIVEGSSLTL